MTDRQKYKKTERHLNQTKKKLMKTENIKLSTV